MKNSLIVLWLIIFLAAALRLFEIGSIPPSASLDESSIGYNAYSILHTGRDEYGTQFPVLLRAYDDYRPALYVYFVVPFIQLLGPTVTAVRLPSVILSILEIWLVYAITKTIFSSRKDAETVGVLAALLLAVSPWHIYISRLGHEANLGLFFVIAGTYFFVKSIADSKYAYFMIFSGVTFALSLWGYQSQKIVVPALLIIWTALFFKRLWKIKFWVFAGIIAGALICIPLVRAIVTTPDAMLRFQSTSAVSPEDALMIRQQEAFVVAKEARNVWGEIWYNRRIAPIKIIAANYFSHFSVRWLFFGSQQEAFKAPYTGLLYPWELLFLLIGFIAFVTDKKNRLALGIMLPVLLTAPMAASVTTMAPHAMRAYTFLPALQIAGSLGIVTWLGLFPGRSKTLQVAVIGILFVVSAAYFVKEYFFVFPRDQSKPYQYALHQAIRYALGHEKDYDAVVVSIDEDLTESYMFYLFDSAYDPALYLKAGGTRSGGFAQWHTIGKWSFRPVTWQHDKQASVRTLFLANPREFGPDAKKIATFEYRDGEPGVEAAENGL